MPVNAPSMPAKKPSTTRRIVTSDKRTSAWRFLR
jgi:hypothetical protein